MDIRPTWIDCGEAGDYVVPNVLSPKDLTTRPDNLDETVPHTVPPLGKELFTRITVYSQSDLSICNFSYFPF